MSNQSVIIKNTVAFGSVMAIGVLIILVWLSYSRNMDYRQYHQIIADESVTELAENIAHFIAERNRLVRLFAEDHLSLILKIAKSPDDDTVRVRLTHQISRFFPDYFAFTLADSQGQPYFEDFDGLISESCSADLKSFADVNQYHPYVHPNTEGYHFDVMAPFGDEDNQGILFISFHVDILGSFIQASQSLGHNLMLLYPQLDDLIEVIASGARNKIVRDDYRLSESERLRILTRKNVKGTRWQAVDQYQEDLFFDFETRLWTEAAILSFVVLYLGFIMMLRVRREESFREIAEAKRHLLEKQKEEIMGVISHEIRSPISAITGSLDLLAPSDYEKLESEAKILINNANVGSKRLLMLVNDLLDAHTLESGNLNFDLKQENLISLVKNAIEYNQIFANTFNVTYKYASRENSVMVNCDASRIDQVLTNLLTNAAKYGGEDKQVEITVEVQDALVRVGVTDHGPGISKEFQAKVFDRYSVESLHYNAKYKSIGLGLNIVKNIIEKHGGKIYFDTTLGAGSTFYFELPTVKD